MVGVEKAGNTMRIQMTIPNNGFLSVTFPPYVMLMHAIYLIFSLKEISNNDPLETKALTRF